MKKFLTTFAAIAAGFAAQNATSKQLPAPDPARTEDSTAASTRDTTKIAVQDTKGEAFNFVLKRSEVNGSLMAYHQSHASHASHSSHASHYSSRQ